MIEFHAVPGAFHLPGDLAQTHAPALMFHVPHHTEVDQQLHEPENVGVLGQQVPVEPTRIIVLTVGVIVAALTTPHLIAHNKHRHTERKHGRGEKALYLPVTQPLYMGIVRRAFDAAVPASILLPAITVVLAVFLVVLLVIGDEVVEGEAIVARNEIDALFGLALPLTINAWAAEQTVGHAPHGVIRAPEEVADTIAKLIVPFLPAISHKAADLIK